ncbi:MAG: hypothetical protein VYA14_03925 [Pseudomonadota bacterium]|nr:hypothetical protein [Pseudomonadota bacterium]
MQMIRQYKSMIITLLLILSLSACVTARIEDNRLGNTGIGDGEGVVILAKSYHLGNDTETDFIRCVSSNISKGSSAMRVIPTNSFKDTLFPWFEPRTAPSDTRGLTNLLKRNRVAEIISENNIRYIIWLDGNTDSAGGGGSMSCAMDPTGAGCFGFAWWQNDSKYEATIWDIRDVKNEGNISAEYSGTSFLPAIVVPIPLFARTQTKACKGLSDQLKVFISG